MTLSKISAAVAAVAAAGLASGPAQAVPMNYSFNACPAPFTADGTSKVFYDPVGPATNESAASQCTYLSPLINATDKNSGITTDEEVNVNDITGVAGTLDGFFGFTNWLTTGLDHVNVNAKTGTWTIPAPDLNFAAFNYMLIFKDGGGTSLIGFLLNEEVSSGSWSTPFLPVPFTGSPEAGKDVSHISLYKSAASVIIPEPGTLALFGAGLVAAAGLRRRKKV